MPRDVAPAPAPESIEIGPVVLRRTFSPAFLNTVANHPEVRPWLAPEGAGAMDTSALVTNPANFALVTDGGGFVLHQRLPGLYEVHSMFLPEGRRNTKAAMRAGFDYMFTRTDCERIVTQVPDNNRPAQALAKVARFRPMFHREQGYLGPTQYMGLTLDDWVQDNAELEADGEWFHSRLEQAKQAAGSSLETHAHDRAHERAVGAAVRMVRAGNAQKAVAAYSRWAIFAGYAPINLISAQPIVIDVGDAVVGFNDNEMDILLCR